MCSKEARAHFRFQQEAKEFYVRPPNHSELPEVEQDLINSLFLHFREFHKKGHPDSNYIFNANLNSNPMGSYKIRDGHIVGLTLGKNFTASIPQAIGDLLFLETLEFSHLGTPNSNILWAPHESKPMPTSPPVIFPSELDKLTSLRVLWIEGCRLTEVPSFVGKQLNLERLLLRNEFITKLPDFLAPLTNLTDIHFADIPITHLPSFIGNWSNLKRMRISGLPLTTLPDSIGDLIQLGGIQIDRSEIHSLPDSLGKMIQLKFLSIKSSKLHSLPDSIKQLQNLKTIKITSSLISTIPEIVKHIQNLRTLDFSSNSITALPEWISEIAQLKSLSLNDNQIMSLSLDLTFLNSLQIQDNPLRTLSGIPRHLFKPSHRNLRNVFDTGALHPEIEEILGKSYVSRTNIDKTVAYYAIPPHELARRYARDVLSLSIQEKSRLLWEGGPIERDILEAAHFLSSDPVIRAITDRLSVKTRKNFSLLL